MASNRLAGALMVGALLLPIAVRAQEPGKLQRQLAR